MKNIRLLALLLCTVLLFTACAVNPNPDPSASSDPSAPSEEPSFSTDPTVDPAELLKGIVRPSKDPNYFEFLCENVTGPIYPVGGVAAFGFFLISTSNLEGKIISLSSDIGGFWEGTIHAPDSNKVIMSLPTFMSYQGFDWETYAKDETAFAEERARYSAAYSALRSSLPSFYTYSYDIGFNFLGADTDRDDPFTLGSVTVTIKDPIDEEHPEEEPAVFGTKTYDLNNILFSPYTQELPWGTGLSQSTYHSVIKTPPSKAGTVEDYPAIRMHATADLTLTGLSFSGHEGVSLIDCKLTIQPEKGAGYTVVWDGATPIEIDSGTLMDISISLEDVALAEKLIASSFSYLIIEYSAGADQYQLPIAIALTLSPREDSIYAMKVDQVDVLPYYTVELPG